MYKKKKVWWQLTRQLWISFLESVMPCSRSRRWIPQPTIKFALQTHVTRPAVEGRVEWVGREAAKEARRRGERSSQSAECGNIPEERIFRYEKRTQQVGSRRLGQLT